MDLDGRTLHQQAAQAREAGNLLEALKLSDEAALAYQKQNDLLGFTENLVDRSITYRHLAEQTGNNIFLIIAEHEAMAAVEIAQKSGQKEALALPLFRLGSVKEKLGKIEAACQSYKEAVENMENNPPSIHNRPAVLLDMKIHLFTCEYKTGDKSALEKAEQALSELKQTDEEEYNKHVWVSGGHMRIADILREDNPEKAKEHLQKAKEVIDIDERLTLRKAQWEKLSQTF